MGTWSLIAVPLCPDRGRVGRCSDCAAVSLNFTATIALLTVALGLIAARAGQTLPNDARVGRFSIS